MQPCVLCAPENGDLGKGHILSGLWFDGCEKEDICILLFTRRRPDVFTVLFFALQRRLRGLFLLNRRFGFSKKILDICLLVAIKFGCSVEGTLSLQFNIF